MKRMLEVVAVVLAGSCVTAPVASAGSSPSVVTRPATGIKQTSALLGGSVDPNGAATAYVFQLGLTTAYGVTSRGRSAGAGVRAVSVTAVARGLIPGTRYHYRLVALNRFGVSVGADRTFTTSGHPPPAVATGPAAQLGPRFATLTGVVNPNGQATTWMFEYGTTPAYGVRTFGGTLHAGRAPVIVASPLQGLAPATIFHYRLVAMHAGSVTSFGADATFMTYPLRRRVPRTTARTTPRHARRAPFTFTTTGVVHTAGFPSAFACQGDVAVRVFLGRRLVRFGLAPVQPNCTFAIQTVFVRLPPHPRGHSAVTLWVFVRFLGNGYLAPARAHPRRLVLT